MHRTGGKRLVYGEIFFIRIWGVLADGGTTCEWLGLESRFLNYSMESLLMTSARRENSSADRFCKRRKKSRKDLCWMSSVRVWRIELNAKRCYLINFVFMFYRTCHKAWIVRGNSRRWAKCTTVYFRQGMRIRMSSFFLEYSEILRFKFRLGQHIHFRRTFTLEERSEQLWPSNMSILRSKKMRCDINYYLIRARCDGIR